MHSFLVSELGRYSLSDYGVYCILHINVCHLMSISIYYTLSLLMYVDTPHHVNFDNSSSFIFYRNMHVLISCISLLFSLWMTQELVLLQHQSFVDASPEGKKVSARLVPGEDVWRWIFIFIILISVFIYFQWVISCSTRGVCIDTQVIAWTRDAVSQVMILDRKVSALAFGIPWGLADFQKACGDFAIILM